MDTDTATATTRDTSVPLCVDLDGTLIKTDLLWESLVRLLRCNPLWALAVPFWWARGRAFLKRQIAARITLNPASLPFNEKFLAFLREQKRAGRKLILVTASDGELAGLVAQHLGLFDEILGSDGKNNLRGASKLRTLTERFGERGFDYAGNSSVDLAVWPGAREAIVVNADDGLARRAAGCAKLGPTFPRSSSTLRALFQTLRPHQWVKNLIVFVPLITAHRLTFGPVLSAAGACAALCLCASGVYVLNDLMDLDADRQHPSKRERPFAAGNLPLSVGLALFPALLVLSGAIAWWMSLKLVALLAIYLIATTAYSWRLKRIVLLDVFVLAGLYTLRLIAGHVVTGTAYSAWLLVFSMFIFLSLALMKRFRELQGLRQENKVDAHGRGYTASDLELVATLGLMNGSLAVLVLALYVNSDQVVKLYRHPMLLLLICPLMLFWISRVWLMTHRGQMHTDPVVFVLKDWTSYAVGALALLVVWLATGH